MPTAAGLSARVAWMSHEEAKRRKEQLEKRIKALESQLEDLGADPPVAAWNAMGVLSAELNELRRELRCIEKDPAPR